MNWNDLAKKLARDGLPTLGRALGGPLGGTVGAMVAERLGAPQAGPGVIAQAMAGDPDAMLELRRIDKEMADREAESAEKLAEIETADRQDARKHHGDDIMRQILAAVLPIATIGFAGGLIYMLFKEGQITEAVGMGGMVLGWLIRDASASNAFFFGTSLGSTRRADQIERMNSGKDL